MWCRSRVKSESGGFCRLLRTKSANHGSRLATAGEGVTDIDGTLARIVHKLVEQRGNALNDASRTAISISTCQAATEHNIVGPSVIERKNLDHHLALLAKLLLIVQRFGDMPVDIHKSLQAGDGEKRRARHI